jgi:hypothetical protein
MNNRRNFFKVTSAGVLPAAAVLATSSVARADAGNVGEFPGAWNTVHTLPFPPGQFRELISFAEGGVFRETNSFLHTASNLDFSAFGLPNVVNASDGVGNWSRTAKGVVQIVFRKLLFNGARQNFGDLLVTGAGNSDGATLHVDWHIQVVDLSNKLLLDFGMASSQGTPIG